LYAEKNDERDLARKIIQLLDDPRQREEMGLLGRRRVETELEWKYEAPKLLLAYDLVFSARNGSV
jgi:glycosyltransferase involved in cell wall biosynthesis